MMSDFFSTTLDEYVRLSNDYDDDDNNPDNTTETDISTFTIKE